METIEVRLNTLELIVKEIAHQQLKNEIAAYEMKEDTRILKEEMKEFKDEMRVFKDEMKEFKDEMKEFKQEMQEYREDEKRWKRERELEWGRLANKWGTFVEDVAEPNLKRIAREVFGQGEPDFCALRIRTKVCELDLLAVYKDIVIINESKSGPPKTEYVDTLLETIEAYLTEYPEHRRERVVPVYSALRIEDSFVSYLTKRKVFALAMGEYTMDLLNADELLKGAGGTAAG